MIDMINLLLIGVGILTFSIIIECCVKMPKVLYKLNSILIALSVMLICGASVNLMWVS